MVEALQGVDVLTSIVPNIENIAAQLNPDPVNPSLKLVQIQAAGYDEFTGGGPPVLEGLRKHGVMLANNGGSNAVGVGQTTIMLMLAVYAQIPFNCVLVYYPGTVNFVCTDS